MVVWSKILPLLAAGVGVLFLVNAFTRPAHAQQTAGALGSTFSTLGTFGDSIASFGSGIGKGLSGLFAPVWEISNLFERFSNLSGGSANVSPVAQEGLGNDSPTWTVSGGSSNGGGYTADPSDTGGGSIGSGAFGSTDTSYGWGI
jgi:hypothetical protein